MSDESTRLPEGPTPFERFEELTRRLLAVPKRELDEKRDEEKQRKLAEAVNVNAMPHDERSE